jgi:hypothetical protein
MGFMLPQPDRTIRANAAGYDMDMVMGRIRVPDGYPGMPVIEFHPTHKGRCHLCPA